MKTVGLTMKSLRKEKNKTLKEVAEAASISKSYLSDIENDKRTPDLEKIFSIADALGADPFAILLKAKVEDSLPPEKRKLLREFAPILRNIDRMIKELYDDDDDDDKGDNSVDRPQLKELDTAQ